MIANINTRAAGSYPSDFVKIGSTTFFMARTLATGQELWKTDGTAPGTVPVKDIWPGPPSGAETSFLENKVAVDDVLYFVASDGVHGFELWRSDGTETGTFMVRDLVTGPSGSGLLNLVNLNGTLYFLTGYGSPSLHLQRSDGMAAGTTEITVEGLTLDSNSRLNVVGNSLYLTARGTNPADRTLWRSDGTEAGTVELREFTAGSASSPADIQDFVNLGPTVLFRARDGVNGSELWKTDGTPEGTTIVKDIRPGPGHGLGDVADLTVLGDTLYFVGDNGTSGAELWKSDGTASGTSLVKDIRPGAGSSLNGFRDPLARVGNRLALFADDGTSGRSLWTSDGTSAGTRRLKGPGTGGFDLLDNWFDEQAIGDTLYFVGFDFRGLALWRSDGTTAGTVFVTDLSNDPYDRGPSQLFNAGGLLLFQSDNGLDGPELYRSDGTPGGTVRVKEINTFGDDGSNSYTMTVVGDTAYFTAYDNIHGFELWRTDGTGVSFVNDIRSGAPSSEPSATPVNVNGALFFAADDGFRGRELWVSDGTAAGTTLVKDIALGVAGSIPTIGHFMTAFGNLLIFAADDGSHGFELWRSDGTPAGTMLLRDINPGTSSGIWRDLVLPEPVDGAGFPSVVIGQTLYFVADDGTHGLELWKTDGTAAGTVLVRDIAPGMSDGYPINLATIGGTLYFRADDETHGPELWKSDGTAAGTVLVKDIVPGRRGGYPSSLVDLGGTLYFAVTDLFERQELWKSDGTAAGTVLVKDLTTAQSTAPLPPSSLIVINGTLFFTAIPGPNTIEIWRSDGTGPGTLPFKTFPYPAPSIPLSNLNGILAFPANDGIHGSEIWISNGTADGTVMLADIFSGPNFSVDHHTVLALLGGRLVFTADDGIHGAELWSSRVLPERAPALTVPRTTQSATTDTVFAFSTSAGNAIRVDAPDTDAFPLRVTLAIEHGTISLSTFQGLTFATGDGTDDRTLVFTGMIDPINAALAGLTFRPDPGFAGDARLTLWTTSTGYSRVGGPFSAADSVSIVVTPPPAPHVNQPPTIAVPAETFTAQGVVVIFALSRGNAITIADPDAGDDATIRVTLTAVGGTLTLGSASLVLLDVGRGANDSTMTFRGTLSTINAALEGLTYVPSVGFSGTGGVSIVVDDQGFTGVGRPRVGSSGVVIRVLDRVNPRVVKVEAQPGKGGTTKVRLTFSESLDPITAQTLGAYSVKLLTKGRRGLTEGKALRVASALYESGTRSILLTLRTKLTSSQTARLRVIGTFVRDSAGNLLDGVGQGQAGSIYVGTIKGRAGR